MKVWHGLAVCLTMILSLTLPTGCSTKSKKTDISEDLKAYQLAQKAQDYNTACGLLLRIVAKDSAGQPWAYDSLALYHYAYLTQPGLMRNPATPMFFTERGLTLNSTNPFLLEMKAKLLLEEKNDTLAFSILTNLWNKTHDYTYLWDMTLIEMIRGNVRDVDSVVKMVLTSPEPVNKTVRIIDQVQQTVNARAAFLWIKASMINRNGDYKTVYDLLMEATKLSPDFLYVRKALSELQQNAGVGGQSPAPSPK